jgi:hypothetical protein
VDNVTKEQVLNEDDQLFIYTCGKRTFMAHQLAIKLMRRVGFKQHLDINRNIWEVARYSVYSRTVYFIL